MKIKNEIINVNNNEIKKHGFLSDFYTLNFLNTG